MGAEELEVEVEELEVEVEEFEVEVEEFEVEVGEVEVLEELELSKDGCWSTSKWIHNHLK